MTKESKKHWIDSTMAMMQKIGEVELLERIYRLSEYIYIHVSADAPDEGEMELQSRATCIGEVHRMMTGIEDINGLNRILWMTEREARVQCWNREPWTPTTFYRTAVAERIADLEDADSLAMLYGIVDAFLKKDGETKAGAENPTSTRI